MFPIIGLQQPNYSVIELEWFYMTAFQWKLHMKKKMIIYLNNILKLLRNHRFPCPVLLLFKKIVLSFDIERFPNEFLNKEKYILR